MSAAPGIGSLVMLNCLDCGCGQGARLGYPPSLELAQLHFQGFGLAPHGDCGCRCHGQERGARLELLIDGRRPDGSLSALAFRRQ